ncbi:putative polyamine transporter [Forsythia ovata]|uniref:Polyamine transporter n=1 Tax=Forsythia ovata TaxID=205694 RepID=A0ABD1W3B6_9LAMI
MPLGMGRINSPKPTKLRETGSTQTSIAMEEFNGAEYIVINEVPFPRANHGQKISHLPLVFLIFYEVSGGPFGVEDSVNAAGPLLALVGFLVFSFIWSVPEALITAEMGTMFPENGGYVVWVSSALGPYWGFQQGWMKCLSGVIDNALYPVLFLDYLKSGIPALGGGLPRILAVLALKIFLTYMNYRGLTIVGWVAVLLGIFSILPFVVMGFISIRKNKAQKMVSGRCSQCGLEFVPEYSFLESELLGLNKYTFRRSRKSKENSAKGSVLCIDSSCSWVFLLFTDWYWCYSPATGFMD